MSVEQKLETGVKQVLQSNSVNKAQKLLEGRSGIRVLTLISFLESALPVPILTDPFLIAAILVDRKNAAKLVFSTTVASVIGGVFAFFIALLFFETLSQFMTVNISNQFNELITSTESSAFVLTLMGAVTPIPYTVVAWVVAVLKGSLLVFILASVLGRGLRYSIVGYCVYRFGPLAVSYTKKYLIYVSVLLLILGVIFLWFKM